MTMSAQSTMQDTECHVTPSQKWLIFFAMCLAIFIVAFATTATTNAMVPIRAQMNLNTSQLQWTTNAYILAAATLMILGGLLSDRYGRRNMNVLGGLTFIAGSIVCATSTTGALFIIGRFIQGVGVAVIMPGTLALMKVVFPKEEQGVVTSGWAVSIGLGMGLGPFFSGVFCETIGWPYLFGLIAVVMLIALILLVIAEHQRLPINTSVTIDLLGFLVFICGFAVFIFGFVEGGALGWGSPTIISLLVVGVLVMTLQPWVERHVKKTPFINFEYFKRPRFSLGCIGMFIDGYLLISLLFFGNLYMQSVLLLNYTPYQAGLAVIPMGVGLSLSVLMVEKLIQKIGLAACIYTLLSILIASVIWFACLDMGTSYSVLWGPFFLAGVGCGMATKAFPTLAIQALSPAEAARSSSVVSSFLYIGVIFATCIGTILSNFIGRSEFLSRTASIHLPTIEKLKLNSAMLGHPAAIKHMLALDPSNMRHALYSALQVSALKGFQYAMLGCLVFCVIAMIMTKILLSMKEYVPPNTNHPT